MRKQMKGRRFLSAALAVVLACGMMVPTGAMAWADDGSENSTTFDQVVGEAPQQGSSMGDAISYVAQTAVSFNTAESDVVPATEPVATPMAVNTVSSGGFTFTGEGIAAGDFPVASNLVSINTSTPVTVSGTSTTTGLMVPAGKTANLTLSGVTISAPIALEIKATGVCNLVLADGKSNSLTSTSADYAGLHCGTGATLTIDDSVPNVDTLGNPIVPFNGQIPAGTMYVDAAGATHTSTGDPLTNLDAVNPGSLTVKGGGLAAALGGAKGEDGGNMTFNGGIISVTNGSGPTVSSGNCGGAGIGGGQWAAGTSPKEWITINGGRITANAAYHGAGIGGGWNTSGHTATSGLTLSGHPGGTGNIRINGGYIVSNGGNDGNGFGRGCYGGRTYCDNRVYTILVTGGTMIPKGGTNLGEWGMDIGGSGTDPNSGNDMTVKSLAATVCISGGSVYVTPKTSGGYRFDGTAYGTFVENADGSITVNKDAQVVPITIDLTADLMALDGLTTKPNAGSTTLNRTISYWDLLVNGEVVNYGAPAQFNEGKLYLWLTPEQAAQNVEVRLAYKGPDGSDVNVEPLYRPAGSSSGETNLKRYVYFDLQSDFYNQVGGGTGTGTVSYETLSSYEQKKYADVVDASGNVTVPTVTKPYDGKPYSVRDLSSTSPINSGGDDKKNIWSNITYVAQLYDPASGKLGAEQTTTALPSDTGLTRFTMTSTQYSADAAYSASYYGHRAYGWCAITPVPAVVKISETDGTAWVRLSDDGSSYKLVKEGDAEAGNRLRVAFDVRSARGTATSCKAPTGSFQILIDGNPIGGPVSMTATAMAASPGSKIEMVIGDEGRETTRVVYYLDPTNLDGALEALEDADTNVHDITVQYLPDKNYVEGTEEDTDPEEKTVATQPTTIIPVKPTGDVTPDGPGDITITTTPDPEPGPDGDTEDPTDKITVIRKTIRASYSEFHNGDVEVDDFFKLKIVSSSDMPPVFSVSNPAVADVLPNDDGTLTLDADGKLPVQVNSCGTSVITMEQRGNAIYTGTKYILTVEVTPDKALKPQVQIRMTSRNLTALFEKAEEAAGTEVSEGGVAAVVSAVAAVYADGASRAALPPRPGDVMEYTVSGINMTPGSAWQGAELTNALSASLTFVPSSVEVARNYTTPSDRYTLGTPEFYAGFDWQSLEWESVDASDYTFADQTLKKSVGSVYGGQSTSVRFQATVADGTGKRPDDGELFVIESEPGGSGGYGKEEDALVPGEEAEPAEPLEPGTDIVIVGDGGTDEDEPMKPIDEDPKISEPVLPRDPAAADITTEVKVETIATEEKHEPDRILVGDTLRITATSTNNGPDSKLVDAVIKVTLPKGAEPKEGTIMLIDADGVPHSVPYSAYDPVTGIIAVNAGDLYGGESAQLVFEAVIESTKETRRPGEGGDERPEEFPIQGGTLGGTPTGEYIDTHPEGPDGPVLPPEEKPEPGSPFVPNGPWSEYEKEVVSGTPGTDTTMPPVLPKIPKIDGDSPDITVDKTASNDSRDDGTTHVGDKVTYNIKLSNSKAHSIWYDAVIRDNLPVGVEPMSGTIKLIGTDGTERSVPDSAYDVATRIMGVQAGDLPGGSSVTLTFQALVTEDAKDADIGNFGTAYGTTPGQADPEIVSSVETRPTPGTPFKPEDGWGNWDHGKDTVTNDKPAYSPGANPAEGGVKDADGNPNNNPNGGPNFDDYWKDGPTGDDDTDPYPGGDGGNSDGNLISLPDTGTNPQDGTISGAANGGQRSLLASTGDDMSQTVIALVSTAAVALLVVLMALRRKQQYEQ